MSFSAFIAEFRGIVVSQLGASTGSIYTSIEISKESFINGINAGSITLPAYLIEIGKASADTDFSGLDVTTLKRASVTVHKIAQYVTESQDSLSDAMLAFINWVDDAARQFTTFQSIEPGDIDSDISAAINAQLFVQSETQTIAVSGAWMPGFLVGFSGS